MSDRSFSIKRIDPYLDTLSFSYIKKISSGNITEFLAMSKFPSDFPVRKIDKDHFVFNDTGEVKEFSHSCSKADCYDSVRRSLSVLRGIINANCVYPERIRWCTLTYADNMCDPDVLYRDFQAFWKRFKRYLVSKSLEIPDYISVVEPQARGAWHSHLLLIFPSDAPFIDNNSVFYPLWGHGFTKVKAVSNVDNLGAYFSAYLADLPLDDYISDRGCYPPPDAVIIDKVIDGRPKSFVKGSRLSMYPPGMNIFRTSRSINRPVVSLVEPEHFEKEKVSAGTLTYGNGCSVIDDITSESVNTICRFYYNSKRK